jgi:hypothetical protein
MREDDDDVLPSADDVADSDDSGQTGGRRQTRTREKLGLGERNTTINLTRVSDKDRVELRKWLPIYEEYASERPKTRGDCVDGPRPCPWVSCRHNNYLDEKQSGPTAGRAVILNFPDIEPHEVPPERSCALDIADKGGATLEDVALITNLTRERIRQVQDMALIKLRRVPGKQGLGEFVDGDEKLAGAPVSSGARSSLRKTSVETKVPEEDDEENSAELTLGDGDTLKFLSEHPRADQIVTARVWRIYLRSSVTHGFETRGPTKQELLEDVHRENSDADVSEQLSVRHNGGMAHVKKKTTAPTKKTHPKPLSTPPPAPKLTPRQQKILETYTTLCAELKRVPNNMLIAHNTGFPVLAVQRDRKVLVKLKLVKQAPRGASPGQRFGGAPKTTEASDAETPVVRKSQSPATYVLEESHAVKAIDAELQQLEARRKRLLEARAVLTKS